MKIFLFACPPPSRAGAQQEIIVWVAQNIEEEELLEEWMGCELEPQQVQYQPQHQHAQVESNDLKLIPSSWFRDYPTTLLISQLSIAQIKHDCRHPSKILLKRR